MVRETHEGDPRGGTAVFMEAAKMTMRAALDVAYEYRRQALAKEAAADAEGTVTASQAAEAVLKSGVSEEAVAVDTERVSAAGQVSQG